MRSMRSLVLALAVVASSLVGTPVEPAEPAPIRVVIWDERQPEQKQAYDAFLGNEIATRLSGRPGIEVR